jgi:hypothetical protein
LDELTEPTILRARQVCRLIVLELIVVSTHARLVSVNVCKLYSPENDLEGAGALAKYFPNVETYRKQAYAGVDSANPVALCCHMSNGIIKLRLNVSTETAQVREMSWDSRRRRNIINDVQTSSLEDLELSGDLWASSVTMEPFQPDLENIIVALQSNRSLETIIISRDFLAAIGESDQGRLFRSLGNLPTLQDMSVYGSPESPTVVHMRALADALSETSNGINTLNLSGFKISSRSEVEQLARSLKARVGSLERLFLEDIVLDGVEDKVGFLDPILLALAPVPGEPRSPLTLSKLSCAEAASNGASVVSPEALGAFFAKETIELPRLSFYLHHLGLNDNHCKVMVQELARDDALLIPIHTLNLSGNSSIGQKGYEALLGLLNQRFEIVVVEVDDQKWKATFDLVLQMNHTYPYRGRFLENGVFPSKVMWVDFLAELAKTYHYEYCNEAQKLNAIWYTLREDPDFVYT